MWARPSARLGPGCPAPLRAGLFARRVPHDTHPRHRDRHRVHSALNIACTPTSDSIDPGLQLPSIRVRKTATPIGRKVPLAFKRERVTTRDVGANSIVPAVPTTSHRIS